VYETLRLDGSFPCDELSPYEIGCTLDYREEIWRYGYRLLNRFLQIGESNQRGLQDRYRVGHSAV
jgi:hypothetical protein